MTLPSRVVIAIVVTLTAFSVAPVRADWPSSSTTNLPICTATGVQIVPSITTDMAGGAFVAWHDLRVSTDANIYAHHVLSTGVLDPNWPTNGLLVCGAAGGQSITRGASDGSGGLLLTWTDNRSGTSDIYAHHVLANGSVDPSWPADGLPVCTATGSQSAALLVRDGTGGALVAWRDLRNDTDLYVMRVRSNGVVDPAWPVDGLALASGVGAQKFGAITPIVSDGSGGLFATWQDTRSGPDPDIYAQHLLVNGNVAAGWPANGLPVCTATGVQEFPSIARDNAGGIFVCWEDLRGSVGFDVYAQHVPANGAVDPAWPANGRAVSLAAGDQYKAVVLADAVGGAYVAWVDRRAGSLQALYAQHLLSNGTLDPAWPVGDLAFNPNFGSHANLCMMPDGTGGALIVWDSGAGGSDVYAHHLLLSGVDPAWPSGGRAVSAAANTQSAGGAAIPDGSGGLIAAWADTRSGANNDIYAQRVQANGALGGSVVGVPHGLPGAVALAPPAPNPWRGGALTVRYTLGAGSGAILELLDLAGRVLASRALAPGEGEARFENVSVAPGIYFVVLRENGGARDMRTTRVVALR